jgi:hypothetical protein
MAEEQEPKTLGQIAYEVMHHGHYPAVNPAEQARWESVGQAVRAAVLAEEGAPTGPVGMAEQELDASNAIYHAVRLTLAGSHVLSPEAQVLISTAIERGILAGLRAWEVTR